MEVLRPFCLIAALVFATAVPVSSQQLEIHCIDVGQGSSELFIGPDGTTILVDGGSRSAGQSELLPYLNSLFSPGDRTLNYVIASHDDSDHYGGLNYILDHGYSAGTIYHCGYNSGFGRGEPIAAGTVIALGSGATATCVLAGGHFADGTYYSVGDSNNASVALLIEYGDFDYITAGDLEQSLEDDLADMLVYYINPPSYPVHSGESFLDPSFGVDVMHANHHGSRYSSSDDYVNLLRCEVALINGGTAYGHPHRNAVDRLLARSYYTIDCSCSGGGSSCGKSTGITVPGAEVYRTTAGEEDCRRSPEEDCPTVRDIIVTCDGGGYYGLEGTLLPFGWRSVDEGASGPPPTPTPVPQSPTPAPPPAGGASPEPSDSFSLETNGSLFAAGEGLTLAVNVRASIRSPFDAYLVAQTPIGQYTIHLDGSIGRGVVPVAGDIPRLDAPFRAELLSRFPIPQAVRGTTTFHAVVVKSGTMGYSPPLEQLIADTPDVIVRDETSIEVE